MVDATDIAKIFKSIIPADSEVIKIIKKIWPDKTIPAKNLEELLNDIKLAHKKKTQVKKEETEDIVDVFEEDIIEVPVNRYQRAKAKVDPGGQEVWKALSLEDKQKHLLEQFELIASGQKTKEAVANELGYVSHNFSTIENAAKVKYNQWLKGRPEDILSQPFIVKNTNQSNKKLIDPDTGYVMKKPSRTTKKKMLEILEATKALKPDNHQWGDDEFSLAFSNEYKKIFPATFRSSKSSTAGSNKYQSDKELAQKMLEFQGSKTKIKNLPVTLRYDESGIQFDITKGGIQSNKADWAQTAIGEPTTGLATKHARTQLLDLDGTWNSVQASIYANPRIKDYLEPLRQAGAAFDIDHIVPIRFGGTNNRNNLRFIIKGSHMGETLPGRTEGAFGMTSVGNDLFPADVKNKSAMETEVYELNKKMINLVMEAISTKSLRKYKEARNIKQDIQTITNNFKKTNPNTDFGVGMPYVVIKTGDDTAANVRLIDYLQLDDNTKKIIETDFIVYDQNLPSAGKSIEKSAEEVGQMYQPFIDAAGGKLEKNLSKEIFEYEDGGFASIEEVLEYNNG
jgi:hypothetical protein